MVRTLADPRRCVVSHFSGLFRDMLSDSIASTSLQNPLPVDERACDFEIMLLIIIGRPEEGISRVSDWDQSARLYHLVSKYQLEGHRLWFLQICRQHIAEEPWEALFLACNQSPIDIEIIGATISEGILKATASKVCDARYFEVTEETIQYRNFKKSKGKVLDSSNVTVLLGLKLGHAGLIAYPHLLKYGFRIRELGFDGETIYRKYPGCGDGQQAVVSGFTSYATREMR